MKVKQQLSAFTGWTHFSLIFPVLEDWNLNHVFGYEASDWGVNTRCVNLVLTMTKNICQQTNFTDKSLIKNFMKTETEMKHNWHFSQQINMRAICYFSPIHPAHFNQDKWKRDWILLRMSNTEQHVTFIKGRKHSKTTQFELQCIFSSHRFVSICLTKHHYIPTRSCSLSGVLWLKIHSFFNVQKSVTESDWSHWESC